MTFDFRASQLRTSKIIASGSTGTNALLLIYPIASQGSPNNQGVIDSSVFGTGSIGKDAFIFISGSINSLGQNSYGAVVLGGDLHSSGNIKAGRRLSFQAGVNASGTFDSSINTTNRTWTFPDADGTVALTNKIIAGTNITINTGATGTLFISSSGGGGGSSYVYQSVASYNYTNLTSPGIRCGVVWYTNSEVPPTTTILRVMLFTSTGSYKTYVKLYNPYMGQYVDLNGVGVDVLSSSSELVEKVDSANLVGASGWMNDAPYELQLYTENGSAVAFLGSAQFIHS